MHEKCGNQHSRCALLHTESFYNVVKAADEKKTCFEQKHFHNRTPLVALLLSLWIISVSASHVHTTSHLALALALSLLLPPSSTSPSVACPISREAIFSAMIPQDEGRSLIEAVKDDDLVQAALVPMNCNKHSGIGDSNQQCHPAVKGDRDLVKGLALVRLGKRGVDCDAHRFKFLKGACLSN